MLTDLQKRFAAFFLGCIPTRTSLAYLAYTLGLKPNKQLLKYMGYIALIPATGFAAIYLTGSRKTGPEVANGEIWWDYLRPVHSALYYTFAMLAINGHPNAWFCLALDGFIGLDSFILYHLNEGNFPKVFRF